MLLLNIFVSSYGWGTNTSKSAFVEGVGHFRGYILDWRVAFTANIYTPLDRGMVLLHVTCLKTNSITAFNYCGNQGQNTKYIVRKQLFSYLLISECRKATKNERLVKTTDYIAFYRSKPCNTSIRKFTRYTLLFGALHWTI